MGVNAKPKNSSLVTQGNHKPFAPLPALLYAQNMKRTLMVFAFLMSLPVDTYANECVILLHGLARTSNSMNRMEQALNTAGYRVINHGYPSRKHNVATLAETEIPAALSHCQGADAVHFVTHSLGGILVRYFLAENNFPELGKVVMLGPPNQGSHVVDRMHNIPGYKLINGKAGMQLGTGSDNLPERLPPADFESGVIAGTRSINLILSLMLPGPNDGKVTVEHTRLDGMADHITVPVSHPFLMRNRQVIRQVLFFLATGQFEQSTD